MALELDYRLQYVGDTADQNMLPAHEGATSLEGITWSFSILANYLATGDIRQRGQMSDTIRVFMKPAKQGSFIQDLVVVVTAPNNVFMTSVLGAYAVATVGQMVNSFIVKAFNNVVGPSKDLSSREERWLDKFPSGDLEALVDRIEPSMKRAHSVINDGATELIIKRGRVPVVTLDGGTKEWVNTSIKGDNVQTRTVSIPAFNANSGNGRAYLPKIGKTVPFSVVREPDRGTFENLAWSLNEYTRKRPSDIEIDAIDILSVDGRVKKLLIEGARRT